MCIYIYIYIYISIFVTGFTPKSLLILNTENPFKNLKSYFSCTLTKRVRKRNFYYEKVKFYYFYSMRVHTYEQSK